VIFVLIVLIVKPALIVRIHVIRVKCAMVAPANCACHVKDRVIHRKSAKRDVWLVILVKEHVSHVRIVMLNAIVVILAKIHAIFAKIATAGRAKRV